MRYSGLLCLAGGAAVIVYAAWRIVMQTASVAEIAGMLLAGGGVVAWGVLWTTDSVTSHETIYYAATAAIILGAAIYGRSRHARRDED